MRREAYLIYLALPHPALGGTASTTHIKAAAAAAAAARSGLAFVIGHIRDVPVCMDIANENH